MTLPAHRYLHRVQSVTDAARTQFEGAGLTINQYEAVEERKKDDGDKQKTWAFDYDETITKAPDQCARMSQAFKKLGDRVVVVTGNTSPRDDLKNQLDDYGFEYDDLIQYSDDQTDGLNRAEILKQLDAFCGFDDRAGRGYTLAKVCPHFFLVAKPPKRAKRKAKDYSKKDAEKDIQ